MLNVRKPGVCAAACAAIGAASLPAFGQGPPDYGFEWRTVGAPGNAHALPRDYEFLEIDGIGPVGRVNRSYRLSVTEVTVADQLEYVRAYSQYYPDGLRDRGFWGQHIYWERNDPNDPGWYIQPGSARYPAEMGWMHAARFSNWLHNGKNTEQWAFESGAYDISTFTRLPNGDWIGQGRRSPGAQFWIPSADEWIKGMYYDPNRNGQDQGGYWLYPITSDTPPVSGFPWTPGAQTSAGYFEGYHGEFFNVGSYLEAMSPWGLLDGSGGVGEWLETELSHNGTRLAKGTSTGLNADPQFHDMLDVFIAGGTSSPGGLRLASVPGPASVTSFAVLALISRRRRMTPCGD